VSPKVEEIYGYKPEDLIGKHLKKTTPISELPKASKALKSVLSGKIINNFEINQLDAEGKIIPMEINATLVRKDGKIIAVQGIMRDLTDRKRAEELYQTIIHTTMDGFWLVDMQGRFLDVNDAYCQLVGYSRDELLKMGIPDVEAIEEPEETTVRIAKIRKAGRDRFETRHRCKDGRVVDVEVSVNYIEVGGGMMTVFARDITERKKLQEQLILTDRLASIGELASGIAHELNNPLTSIIGFSDLLLNQDVSDDVKGDLKVINREAQRTAAIVGNLLTFARKHPPAKRPRDINNIIQRVLELRAYEQRANNILVNTRFAPDLSEITVDNFQLQQVFLNIVINAEHFMLEAHERGNLTITTERVGDTIRASFADDGPGIAKEHLGHLFDPFFTTKEVGKGTGLGLSICHGIIAEHGGKIYAKSKLGKGATFVVELPISN